MQALLQAARRRLRRLRARLHSRATIVYDPSEAYVPGATPMDPRRARKILSFLVTEGVIRSRHVVSPRPASIANLRRVHTDDYLASVTNPETLEGIFGTRLEPSRVDEVLETHRRMTGGTIQATRIALRSGHPGVNLGGGFHHAAPDRGVGFCVYNDLAVAIRRLRAREYDAPVLVVDLDLHDGNGTRMAFADDPTVYTYSIHNRSWDDSPAVASTALALGDGVDDDRYLETLRTTLPDVIRDHRPGLVLYVAGVDVAADDTLGDWSISPEGVLARDQFVIDSLRLSAPEAAVAITLGGGYGPHAWTYTARFLSWLVGGSVLEPSDSSGSAFQAMQHLGPLLRDPELAHDQGTDDGWGLTADDLPGMTGPGADERVLEHYTPHGMELVLDRTGVLEELRARGFSHPTVSVSAEGGLAPTVRVFGDAQATQLLIEFRVTRNRRLIPGFEVLFVEWLLLQNPSAEFSADRPRLPGQSHPGLGMMGQMAGLLVAMSDALELAGVAFLPSNYYIAALSEHHLRFLEPADQARFEALRDALAGMSLADASAALREGRVVDASGETVSWQPAPMVVPLDRSMRQRVQSPAYAEALARARAGYHFRVRGPDETAP